MAGAGSALEARMKCDLCKKTNVRSKNSQLCAGCAEMIQRLLVVQQRIDAQSPRIVAAAAA
jgi:hypothetical protein